MKKRILNILICTISPLLFISIIIFRKKEYTVFFSNDTIIRVKAKNPNEAKKIGYGRAQAKYKNIYVVKVERR